MRNDKIELEANAFAVMILIPEHLLLPELAKGLDLAGPRGKKMPEDMDTLCKKFDVTKTAMAFRLALLRKKYPKGLPKI